jgi:hypothetical protein
VVVLIQHRNRKRPGAHAERLNIILDRWEDILKAVDEELPELSWLENLLKPTGIRVVSSESMLTSYAAISGTVLPAEAWPSAVVSIIPQGSTEPFAVGGVNPEDGSFRAFVPAGVYTVNVVADGYNTYDSAEYTASIGSEVDAGAITLTIPAPPPPDPEPTS